MTNIVYRDRSLQVYKNSKGWSGFSLSTQAWHTSLPLEYNNIVDKFSRLCDTVL